jgi:hypothetical protein
VGSIGRGINVPSAQPNQQGLATVNPIFTWVRLAQRVPVRNIDRVPDGVRLVAGITVTVQIDPRPTPPTQQRAKIQKPIGARPVKAAHPYRPRDLAATEIACCGPGSRPEAPIHPRVARSRCRRTIQMVLALGRLPSRHCATVAPSLRRFGRSSTRGRRRSPLN